MVFRRDEISNMWVPDIQHEAHDAPFHVRIDASFKQDTKGITNAGRWRLIASASAPATGCERGIVGPSRIENVIVPSRHLPQKEGFAGASPLLTKGLQRTQRELAPTGVRLFCWFKRAVQRRPSPDEQGKHMLHTPLVYPRGGPWGT